MLATLKPKNQITLPSEIIKEIGLHAKDQLDIHINNRGEIVLTPVIVEVLPKSMIKDLEEAFEDIRAGRMSDVEDIEETIKQLDLL